jgi:hypothetical protein
MKRKPGPKITPQQSSYVINLFQQGRDLAYVKAATSSLWSDGTYEKLREIAGRGRP